MSKSMQVVVSVVLVCLTAVVAKGTTHGLVEGTPAAQVEALIALYNGTGGREGSWGSCAQGWLSSAEPCTWFGVTCDGQGNVIGLTLADCGLSGPLPDALDGLVKLEFLVLNMNRLTGTLPLWSSMQNLLSVGLYNNSLTGTLPEAWFMHTNLQSVSLAHNGLSGTLPASWRSMLSMQSMSLAHNTLSGTIPLEWQLFLNGSSTSLDVSHNALTGSVPDWALPLDVPWYDAYLGTFIASYNQLSGSLPSWSNVSLTTTVVLSHNELEGTIPDTWRSFEGGNTPSLDLSFNRLTGAFGDWRQSNWKTLLLQGNDLSGSLENITTGQYGVLNVSGNRFSGSVPEPRKYYYCYSDGEGCCAFDVSNNFLTGSLSKSWCDTGVSLTLTENCLTSTTLSCTGRDSTHCSFDLAHQRSTC